MFDHTWNPHPTMPYLVLAGEPDAVVRTKPDRTGRYLWQFRNVCSYSDSIDSARDMVEAGAEFFAVFHRNPYR